MDNTASHSHEAHAGHSHGIPAPDHSGTVRSIVAGIGLNLVIVAVEVVVGIASHSLGLLSDALHNFTDMAALGITWFALAQAKRPASASSTFGFHRTGILTALINSLTLVLVTLWIFWEAYQRLLEPREVGGLLVMATATLALAANLAIIFILKSQGHNDINIRSAVLHLLGDAAASAAVIVAGVLILLTGWNAADPLVSILLGILILWSAWQIIRETLEIFLEQSPRAIDVDLLVTDMKREDGVRDVHDIHVWTLGSGIYALSCHVLVDDVKVSESSRIVRDLKEMLDRDFGIDHSTIEVETVCCGVEGPYCQVSNHSVMAPDCEPANPENNE